MDHITQMYQNRAKVLQEEVTRLEALLEAVVAPPRPKGRSLSALHAAEQADIAKQEAQAEAKAKADAAAEIKKTEDAKKAIEENPISGRITQAHDALIDATYRGLAPIKDNYGKIIGGLVGLDFLGHLGKNYIQKAGKNLPVTSKVLQAAWETTPMAQAVREKAEKAIEAEKLAKEAARQVKLAGEMSELDRFGATLIPGIDREAYDPNTWIEGRPKGAGVPKETRGIPEKAFAAIRRIGGPSVPPEPESIRRVQMRAFSGFPITDPEVWKEAGEGLNDLAMTGKEVGKRTAQLAKGALSVASKGLNAVDPLSLGAEVITPLLAGSEFAAGVAMAPLAIGAFTSEAGKGSDIVAPTEEEIKAREDWAKEQRKQQGLAPVDSITSPTSAVDTASLGAVTVSQQDRAKLERQAMGAKTSTPNLDRIQKQREMLKMLQSGPRMFGGGVK